MSSASDDPRRALVRTLKIICRDGPLPRTALRRALGASPSTITMSVQELLERDFVIESGTLLPTGGRPAKVLDLAPTLGGVLALDIGGINLRVAAADVRGHILADHSLRTPTASDPDKLRETVLEALGAARTAIAGPILAITIAVSGIVHPNTQEVSFAVNIPGWRDVNLPEWLAPFDCPVLVDNEANLAAIGEHSQGCARGAQNVLFIALGAGIGAGLIVEGRPFRGARGAAGEIGYLHKTLAVPGAELEQEAAAGALGRRYREAGGELLVADSEEIFARAAAGEKAAESAVNEVIDELAVGIANVIGVIDPELVVIGGGISGAGLALLEPLRERIGPLVPFMPTLSLSELGSRAALVGAVSEAAQLAQTALTNELGR